ncbi:exo-alpha-sialidase [Paenibacillus hemerocallicola]|uniref:exo-alpha-sialidase n=1 Tax=Paenibacillus hemerocallicola TaxID=1172614 RepID=A0A5C4TDE6_9BACL|nr:sialidase family protein [Paenibacillus hemerocallicola]TNJ66646.1 exo-alpha-sialidase [Paenibacillus hemerocallicola]
MNDAITRGTAGMAGDRAGLRQLGEAEKLFVAGEGGYHTYRIPTLLVTREGTVLAFCEGRMDGQGDAGKIDVLLRRSTDGGRTWGAAVCIAEDGSNTIGNPCPVQDRDTGVIRLLLCRNTEHGDEKEILAGRAPRDVLAIHSGDDGLTWSPLRDISESVKRSDWTWYATGPCHGIQLQSGRLLIPCNHAVLDEAAGRSGPYISHAIYSDDGGVTWQLGNDAGPHTNECTVAELEDGSVYLNMRSYHGRNRRAGSWSRDGGETWTAPELDEALVDPVCQGSVLRLADGPMLLSNLASTKRNKLTARLSADGGRTWDEGLLLRSGPAAYSDLAQTEDGTVLCLYECGDERPYERIVLARLDPR